MNLKEAFRYQNKLQSFMDEAQSILDRDANVTKVENTYLRHKVMAEAEDETVLAVPETEYYEQITDIARFLLYLLDEKEKLFAAIRKSKSELDIDMDSEVSLNSVHQSVARTFKRMNDLRNSEQTVSNGGTGYRFNAEGNLDCQVKCNRRPKNTSKGDFQFRHLRGRRLILLTTAARYSLETSSKDVFLGKYCRRRPFVFSLVPLCHGEQGSAK